MHIKAPLTIGSALLVAIGTIMVAVDVITEPFMRKRTS